MTRRPSLSAFIVAVTTLVACGNDDGGGSAGEREPVTITLVTHDSFAVSDGLLDAFTEDTGIEVKLLQSGDAGTALNQAILTKDDPQGDVFFGVDNTFLTRALDEDLFVPYESAALDEVPEQYVLDPEHRVTPIDFGDVCINYDREFFTGAGAAPPVTLDDLTDPAYKDQLVVENPATSSPGLAFVFATISEFGEDGWLDYWSALRANGVLVADDWEDAYYNRFSGSASGTGDRPLVVSYASSPPAEVAFADPPIDEAPTGVMDQSCFRQIEFAGVLDGTEHEDEAGRLIDFMLSRTFQEDMPLNMFVFPVLPGAGLPEVFVENTTVPADPFEMEPEEIGDGRDRWIREWTSTVLR